MALPSEPSVYVDLTMGDDESLSELSDAPEPTRPSPSKPNTKPKPKSKPGLTKSASSSNLAAEASSKAKTAVYGANKLKARKSEPIPKSTATANANANATAHDEQPSKAKGKREHDDTPSKASSSRSVPISDVVRTRTHVNCNENPIKICHQHHQPCNGALLECTFMRAPGKRCQGRYCFSSLKRLYDQDPETIVKSNRMMINPQEHCPPSETKYAWKCPRCRGKCACSTCRKAAGLEPLGRWSAGKSKSATTDVDRNNAEATKPSKGKAKQQAGGAADQDEPAKRSAKGASQGASQGVATKDTTKGASKGKAKDRTIAEAVAAGPQKSAKTKVKPKPSAAGVDVDVDAAAHLDDGIHTPPPSTKPAHEQTLALLLNNVGVRAPVLKPLKPPTVAPPPVLEVIATKLPEDNMRARMWIYESMVRFDKFGLNRSVLTQLDRFETWTHAMVQDMLGCLLKTIAGLSNIDKGQPTKHFVHAITAYRNHAKSLQRGEPWSAATELLASFGLTRTPLPFVEHDIPVEVEAAAAQRSPSPPAARVTRARQAKENKQGEIARQKSLLDRWEEGEFGETGSDACDDDEDALPSKRRRVATRNSMYVYDDVSDDDASDDESMADPDESAHISRSGRARKSTRKEPTPEVRLTGRQQVIKLQQEQQKEKETKLRHEELHKRQASTDSKDAGSDACGDEDAEPKVRTNGRSEKKRRRLMVGSSDDEVEGDEEEKMEADDKANGAGGTKPEAQDEREMESPDLETKVSILSALIDAAVMADCVAEELKTATESIMALERTHRAANADLEKEIVEELAELNKRAPSIVSPEYQKWKAEKQEMERDHAWRRQDARVVGEIAIDTHALRTGPLGCDVDGREYWHLREYQERMPKFTEGKFAWCVVVLGPGFPVDTDAKQAEMVDEGSTHEKRVARKEEADGSGLILLDGELDNGGAGTEASDDDVQLGLPKSLDKGEAASEGGSRMCMGVNDPVTIKRLIEYVRYRLERVEYEENVWMREREKEAQLGKKGNRAAASSTPTPVEAEEEGVQQNGGAESMYAIRKAKQTLKDAQEHRRKQVEQLVKQLNRSKEYFAWHREEVAP